MRKIITWIIILMLVLTSGCASLVSGTTKKIMISSVPYQTDVSIKDKNGTIVYKGVTPCDVVLARESNNYVSISHPGYKTQEIPIFRQFNGWTLLNALLGFSGVIGIIIDMATGAFWTLNPDLIYVCLVTAQNENNISKTYAVVQYMNHENKTQTIVREMEKE